MRLEGGIVLKKKSKMNTVRDAVSTMKVDECKVVNLSTIGIEAALFRMCLSKISKNSTRIYWTKYNRDNSEITILRVQ
ncbi:hypothetical protein vBKpnSMK54_51 [Klebsiella phage vB_KpnS_MK54]|jgi:hypothetical protein|uniref:hypothetical protein n=1 Tax=Klebsiella phage vB_KpnS_MK54 TaxID=2783667 RepID=UPI001CE7155E|nr:hypothetical protein PRB83_gp51 [Klebsiella phage vB_KpnS_MK54]QZD26093.1 hypothetical protein vBKpnSMK54_51 [Klebsiella phage vB_KpnS_MK54]